jgi:uncharacterized protein (TIGR03437 family)
MLRASAFLLICVASFGATPTPQLTIISAASDSTSISPESLASIFGSNLAPDTAAAQNVPWPESLAGVTVQITDATGTTRRAGLLFVSPSQINFQVPTGTAFGTATVTVTNGSTTLTGQTPITRVAPALFAIDANGIAAATAIRIPIQTEFATPLPVFDCSGGITSCTLVPIPIAVDAPVYLSLYATGVHGFAQSTAPRVDVGNATMPAMYAGPQGQYPGLDQINVALPATLRHGGTVDVTITVDGATSNTVQIAVQ